MSLKNHITSLGHAASVEGGKYWNTLLSEGTLEKEMILPCATNLTELGPLHNTDEDGNENGRKNNNKNCVSTYSVAGVVLHSLMPFLI